MTHSSYVEGVAVVMGERRQWSPTVKLIIAFILGLLALSPAILGLYWEVILARL